MKGSPIKLGGIKGTSGHRSALKQAISGSISKGVKEKIKKGSSKKAIDEAASVYRTPSGEKKYSSDEARSAAGKQYSTRYREHTEAGGDPSEFQTNYHTNFPDNLYMTGGEGGGKLLPSAGALRDRQDKKDREVGGKYHGTGK